MAQRWFAVAQRWERKQKTPRFLNGGDTLVSHTQREKLSSKSVPILRWDDEHKFIRVWCSVILSHYSKLKPDTKSLLDTAERYTVLSCISGLFWLTRSNLREKDAFWLSLKACSTSWRRKKTWWQVIHGWQEWGTCSSHIFLREWETRKEVEHGHKNLSPTLSDASFSILKVLQPSKTTSPRAQIHKPMGTFHIQTIVLSGDLHEPQRPCTVWTFWDLSFVHGSIGCDWQVIV